MTDSGKTILILNTINTMLNLIFRESPMAHKYLDGLEGIEIGAAEHNPFGLKTKNVDYSGSMDTVFKKGEVEMCGKACGVDIVAEGDNLPMEDNSTDFVINSHVVEHFFDPIKALKEWYRVIRPGGYIYIICPQFDMDPTEHRPKTKLQEVIDRHEGRLKPEDVNMENGHTMSGVTGLPLNDRGHWSVWDVNAFLEICNYLNYNVVEYQAQDDKVGNGFAVVIKK